MLQLAAVNGEPGQRQLALCLKSCVFFHLTASRWLEWSQRPLQQRHKIVDTMQHRPIGPVWPVELLGRADGGLS
jgi:hypothetical protein